MVLKTVLTLDTCSLLHHSIFLSLFSTIILAIIFPLSLITHFCLTIFFIVLLFALFTIVIGFIIVEVIDLARGNVFSSSHALFLHFSLLLLSEICKDLFLNFFFTFLAVEFITIFDAVYFVSFLIETIKNLYICVRKHVKDLLQEKVSSRRPFLDSFQVHRLGFQSDRGCIGF